MSEEKNKTNLQADANFESLFNELSKTREGQKEDQKVNLHPQTMCPGFGGLRVLSRINGAQVCLVTDKGCLYGLTFVSQFYAARKSVLSVEITDKTLSVGSLESDVKKALEKIAEDKSIRVIPVVSLCVAETAGFAAELLPKKVGQAEVFPVKLPAYQLRSHPEAKDVALLALLSHFANFSVKRKKTILIVGEIFPLDAMAIGALLQQLGVEAVFTLPSQSLEDYKDAGSVGACAVLHPFYEQTAAFFREKGVPVITGNPVGANATYKWIKEIGQTLELDAEQVERVAQQEKEKIKASIEQHKIDGTVIVAGYEGNEFPLVRLLLEAGLNVPYASTSIKKTELGKEDDKLFEMLGTDIRYRKFLEEDRRAVLEHNPDLVIGTTSLDSYVKEMGIPAIYYTNIMSSRPIYFAQGATTVLTLISGILKQRGIYEKMQAFFE